METIKPAKGFTLAESLIAAVALAIIVLAISAAILAGQTQMHEAAHAQRAMSLAEELIESALALPYEDPDGPSSLGPEADEMSVSDFDNADDYHGYVESAGGLTDAAGSAYPDDFQRFSRTVTAEYDKETVPGLGGAQPGLTITVTVTDQRGRTWNLTRFIPE